MRNYYIIFGLMLALALFLGFVVPILARREAEREKKQRDTAR